MLVQFTIENFKSIKDKAMFSLVASNDSEHQRIIRTAGSLNILPTTLIVGANGAGKSNLIQAIKYLQRIVQKKYQTQFPYYPHKIDTINETRLEIQFIINEIRYVYGLSITKSQVNEEYLLKFINDEEVEVFSRTSDSLTYFKEIMAINPLEIGLTYLNNLSEEVSQVYKYLTEDIIIVLAEGADEQKLFDYTCAKFNDINNQKMINTLFTRLDIGIKQIENSTEGIVLVYDNLRMNLLEESTGTKRLFMFLMLISDVMNDGKVFLFDELERNLHIMLARTIIKMFHSREFNPRGAQLIFSSHNTALLDLNLFRRDQVWLVEKDSKTLSTDIYSLYDIEEVLEDEDIEYGYITGKYGGTFKISFKEVIQDE